MYNVYTATYKISNLAAAKTLMYLAAPSTRAVEVIEAHVTNVELATNEQWEVSLEKISSLGSPTATTVTPVATEGGTAASTVKGEVTASEPTYGSVVHKQGAPSLAGWHYEPPEKARLILAPSGACGVRMISTPTSQDVVVSITFRELGG